MLQCTHCLRKDVKIWLSTAYLIHRRLQVSHSLGPFKSNVYCKLKSFFILEFSLIMINTVLSVQFCMGHVF